MSERALAYSEFPTAHAYVLISEASALHRNGTGATIIRSLAWGQGIRYETVEKTANGLRPRVIEKPGPTGFITTTTRPLDREIATRVLSVQVTDSSEQTRAVVEAAAMEAEGRDHAIDVDLGVWKAASTWLAVAGEKRVVVPFALRLGRMVPDDAVRMRRDFQQLLTMVKTHAFVHQLNRNHDDDGRILAGRKDYEATYLLLCSVLSATLDDVSEPIRETVAAVEKLVADARNKKGVSYPLLAQELGLSKSAVWHRVNVASRHGYLANDETRRSYPARIVLGDPLPSTRAVLPSPEEFFEDSNEGRQCCDPQRDSSFEVGLIRRPS
jgi:biotin operon repressor